MKKTKKKMQEDLETIQDLVKDTQIVFNKYIRLRDKHELCISCKQTAGVGSGGVTHGTFKQGMAHRASSLQERSVLTLVRIL